MFERGRLTFSGEFDSGNLENVEDFSCVENSSGVREIAFKIIPEAIKAWERSYFHFYIEGLKIGDILSISVETSLWRMHRFGMRPIFRIGEFGEMKMIPLDPEQDLPNLTEFGLLQFTYNHIPSSEDLQKNVYFSSCFPYNYAKVKSEMEYFDKMKDNVKDLYYHRDVLCRSTGGRDVDILTISSLSHAQLDKFEEIVENSESCRTSPLFPDTGKSRCNLFSDNSTKRHIFIMSRVHPTEITSSYMMGGLLRFLLHPTDPRSALLRENFVFKLIPVMNPDSVEKGVYRYDCEGNDLNRCYENPDRNEQPAVWCLKEYVCRFNEMYNGCHLFLDLHGDPHKRDVFLWGNRLPPKSDLSREKEEEEEEVLLLMMMMKEMMRKNAMFAKLMEYNCQFFKCRSTSFCGSEKEHKGTSRAVFGEYFYYDFIKKFRGSEQQQQQKKKKRERVITFCYTIECNIFSSSYPLNERSSSIRKNEEIYDEDLIFPTKKIEVAIKKEEEEEEGEKNEEKEYYKNLKEKLCSRGCEEQQQLNQNNILANYHRKKDELFMGSPPNAGPMFSPKIYSSVGKSVLLAILDFFVFKENKHSFLLKSPSSSSSGLIHDKIMEVIKDEAMKSVVFEEF